MNINDITGKIISASIKIHNKLGPGFFESVYEEILAHELKKEGLNVQRQLALPVIYDDLIMEVGYRLDLLVENLVIVEIKSVETVMPVFKKKLLSYLKLKNLQTGLLINFNEVLLKNGITRIYNNQV